MIVKSSYRKKLFVVRNSNPVLFRVIEESLSHITTAKINQSVNIEPRYQIEFRHNSEINNDLWKLQPDSEFWTLSPQSRENGGLL